MWLNRVCHRRSAATARQRNRAAWIEPFGQSHCPHAVGLVEVRYSGARCCPCTASRPVSCANTPCQECGMNDVRSASNNCSAARVIVSGRVDAYRDCVVYAKRIPPALPLMLAAIFAAGAMSSKGYGAPTDAPYGSWRSPITSAMLVQGAVRFGDMSVDGDTLYWVE